MHRLSDTATFLLTLLNNVNELIVKSSDRQSAQEVMKAFRAYAKGKNFLVPQDRVDNFFAIIWDARPATLTILIKDIAEDVVLIDAKDKSKKEKSQ